MRLITLLCVCLIGCGASVSSEAIRPVVAEDRRPELRGLPTDPQVEEMPEVPVNSLGEQAVEAIEEGSPAPWSGILVSETRAMRDGFYRIRYRELRTITDADRSVWSAHRELYEAQIQADRVEIERLQPTWWDRHGVSVGVAGGVIIGAAITIAITFAVYSTGETGE